MPVTRIGVRRFLSFPRRLTVGVLRAMEAIALNVGGRRWKVDRFNRLTERDVRETAETLRAAGAKSIVGIPFYKEAANLGHLVTKVRSDLERRGQNAAIVIVGERKTKDLLLEIQLTSSAPVTVVRLVKPFGFGQKPGLSRRSWSHWEILRIASLCRADVVFIDADVRNAEGWVSRYLDAIRDRGAQVAVADYVRQFDSDDAMVHVWDSLLFGALFKKWVAFRHGGDYAISRDLVPAIVADHSIMRERTYTMDSAIIARAVSRGLKVESIWLGSKEHTPISAENLFQRLPDLVRSVFDDIATHLPGLLRSRPEEAVPGERDPLLRNLLMRDLVGPDFRRALHSDAVGRFRQIAADLLHTLGSEQFIGIAGPMNSGASEQVTLPPRAWAKATLRFLMRYIRNNEKRKRTALVNAYVPVLELGVLGFLNRTFDLTYEDALRQMESDYLVQFQEIWNGLSRRLAVYRLAQMRRWPQMLIPRRNWRPRARIDSP